MKALAAILCFVGGVTLVGRGCSHGVEAAGAAVVEGIGRGGLALGDEVNRMEGDLLRSVGENPNNFRPGVAGDQELRQSVAADTNAMRQRKEKMSTFATLILIAALVEFVAFVLVLVPGTLRVATYAGGGVALVALVDGVTLGFGVSTAVALAAGGVLAVALNEEQKNGGQAVGDVSSAPSTTTPAS